MPAPAPAPAEGGSGLVLGRPFGIPVVVSPSWFFVALLISWVYQPWVARELPDIGAGSWLVALSFAVLLYGSVLVHELSHSVTAVRLGMRVRRITLHLLGGVSEIEGPTTGPGRSFLIAVAGPLTNLVLALAGWLLLHVLPPDTIAAVLLEGLTTVNLLVAGFNLLPGLPLDGGHMLEAGVWRATGRRLAGTRVAAYAGKAIALLLVVVPAGSAYLRGNSPSVVSMVWGLFLASFLWSGSNSALMIARAQERLPGISVRRLLRPAISVTADLPVSEAVRRADEANAVLVVIDANGRPRGVVQAASVAAMPPQRRPWVAAADVSRPLAEADILPLDLEGEALLDRFRLAPSAELVAVDAAGQVSGVVSRADLERALSQ